MAGLLIVHLRHIDDCYRPDAAMTSDAGWQDGPRRRVARAGAPDVSTAVDLFPTLSAFLLHSIPHGLQWMLEMGQHSLFQQLDIKHSSQWYTVVSLTKSRDSLR